MKAPSSDVADIAALAVQANEFKAELDAVKRALAPPDFWYPYSTLSNVGVLNTLLTGERRILGSVIDSSLVADIGAADGDLSFFLERLGYAVHLIDNGPTNFNGLKGARLLKEALGSSVEIHETDLDSQFTLPGAHYGAVFFLGILYHLKNPFYALEALARVARCCFISTRITQLAGDKRTRIEDQPVAYLLDPAESNNDASNYWIFSAAGLERLLARTGWRILDYHRTGCTADSDPASLEGDERAYCLVESVAMGAG